MTKSQPVYIPRGEKVMKAIQDIGYRHSNWQVFQDFLALSAISISNTVDWNNASKREAEYMEIIKRYNEEERIKLAQSLGVLINEMTQEAENGGPYDILGSVFHGLELHNKYKGQFFTPFHICKFMGELTLGDLINEKIYRENYISVCEPCVGSGALVLGFASEMHARGMNYQRELCVTACDIDIKCVHMAYLKLGLFGIPAKIIHGNSLTNEVWSEWYTPTYMIYGRAFKERRTIQDIANAQKVKEAEYEIQIPAEDTLNLRELENGQLCLF